MGTVKYFELYQFPFVLNRFLAVTVELYCRSCLFTLFAELHQLLQRKHVCDLTEVGVECFS